MLIFDSRLPFLFSAITFLMICILRLLQMLSPPRHLPLIYLTDISFHFARKVTADYIMMLLHISSCYFSLQQSSQLASLILGYIWFLMTLSWLFSFLMPAGWAYQTFLIEFIFAHASAAAAACYWNTTTGKIRLCIAYRQLWGDDYFRQRDVYFIRIRRTGHLSIDINSLPPMESSGAPTTTAMHCTISTYAVMERIVQ